MDFYEDGENEGSWFEERAPQNWNNDTEKGTENQELKNQHDVCL